MVLLIKKTVLSMIKIGFKPTLNKIFFFIYNSFCQFQIERFDSNKRQKIVSRIKKKVFNKKKIHVGFFVIFDSAFQFRPLFDIMLNDEIFEPIILVVPDTARGDEHMFFQMQKTYKSLSEKYENVYNSYDYDKKEFIDFKDKVDIVCFNNPYDGMTHKYYRVSYLYKKCFTIFVNYFYFGKLKHELHVIKMQEYKLFSKVFIENNQALDAMKTVFDDYKEKLYVSGYIKMDNFSKKSGNDNRVKNIIIAPHHSVAKISTLIAISNFLTYADFYIELAEKYKNINFVFRPHPLLFVNLKNNNIWNEKEIAKYLQKIENLPNIRYDSAADYFETFAKSDALIHDCGSFLAEYLYTDKPQCYMIREDVELSDNFTENGIKMLSYTYQAKNKIDIINFIESVINEEDVKREDRIKYAKENIVINHKHAANLALQELKRIFSCRIGEK